MRTALSKFTNYIRAHKESIGLLAVFIVHVFFRFYLFSERFHFNWDQVDNAWAARSILVDHKFPLLGMAAKLDSGFHIGPLYYYFNAFIYWIFNLNPIASAFAAGIAGIVSFFVLFRSIKKLFSYKVALIAVGINAVSYFIISGDRSQWPVNFLVPISMIIFYSLYNVLIGNVKYLILLGLGLGLSFHVHFTSVYYLLILLFSLPFLPRKKEIIKYGFLSVGIFVLLISPILIAMLMGGNKEAGNLTQYLQTYYHGFHLTRILQLTSDAFVEFQLILRGWSHDLNYLLVIAFFVIYLQKPTRNKFTMCYLIGLWFVVPWFVMATYSGEISNYYFFSTRPVVLIILAYLTLFLFNQRNILLKLFIVLFWVYFCYINTYDFLKEGKSDYQDGKKRALDAISRGEKIDAYPYSTESYLYYYYTQVNKYEK
jgi:4-amino-4-deoxy-L-arabinose transferase-like glycosyltransferase